MIDSRRILMSAERRFSSRGPRRSPSLGRGLAHSVALGALAWLLVSSPAPVLAQPTGSDPADRGRAAYLEARFEAAREEFQAAVASRESSFEDVADAMRHLAVISGFLGDESETERLGAIARWLDHGAAAPAGASPSVEAAFARAGPLAVTLSLDLVRSDEREQIRARAQSVPRELASRSRVVLECDGTRAVGVEDALVEREPSTPTRCAARLEVAGRSMVERSRTFAAMISEATPRERPRRAGPDSEGPPWLLLGTVGASVVLGTAIVLLALFAGPVEGYPATVVIATP